MIPPILEQNNRANLYATSSILSLMCVMVSLSAYAPAQTARSGREGRQELRLEKVRTVDLKKGETIGRSKSGFQALIAEGAPTQKYAIFIIAGVARLEDVNEAKTVRTFSPSLDLKNRGAKAKVATVSPDDSLAAVYFYLWRYPLVHKSLEVYATATGDLVWSLSEDVYSDMKFSPDSKLLAYTAKTEQGKLTEHTIAIIREVGSWKCRLVIDPPTSYKGISSLAISPDGTIIALGGNKKFGLFPLPTGTTQSCEPQEVKPLLEGVHPDPNMQAPSILKYAVSDITFSTDGARLFTVGEDGTLKEWRIK